MLTSKKIKDISNKKILLTDLSDDELIEFCNVANDFYRRGEPIITDSDYDFVFLAELTKRIPNHSLLSKVESDNNAFGDNKFLLPIPMLSTNKAYSFAEIEKWIKRIKKASLAINVNYKDINIKVTPKLDGFAAFDDGKNLYTRGDGKKGSDISRVFDRGLNIFNQADRGLGAGEIVVKKSYFIKYLSDKFEHPRNFQASIIKEKALDDLTKKAIKDKSALFVPFVLLPDLSVSIDKLLNNFITIVNTQLNSIDFDVDGVILEVINQDVKEYMGSNRKFHRWQIAFKENQEKAQVRVLDIAPQVSRTGKITPVAILEPTFLSGATISHVSCHHYGIVKENNLGKDSIIELIRSGLVIPKINKVLKSTSAQIPKICPSCNNDLIWDNDFLLCNNTDYCNSQIIAKITYFFATIGNIDGFGTATIEKLISNNITSISQIYNLEIKDFIECGLAKQTSKNLVNQLKKSLVIAIEDWRFLAAFGADRLGFGNSEALLKKHKLDDIFTLNIDDIANIDGFAELTAQAAITGLKTIRNEFNNLRKYNFNLEITTGLNLLNSIFSNKKLVFTGIMQNPRNKIHKQAKNIGIIVQKSISKTTDFLIIGDNPGLNKLNKAKNMNITILNEKQYLNAIN